ncbi:MAG TPA: PaaI family thioesterase [Candidatus Polarisedimenticolia bacterium]|nr:PaaI family thioesterase [Candidatus Polarisedimenticolia bacterium]
MTDPRALQDFYPDDFAHCYGCGRLNPTGLHIRTVAEGDEFVARFTPRAEHLAMPGFVYGGLIASLIDCHAMGAASAAALAAEDKRIGEAPSPRFVTARLDVSYLKPTPIGHELQIRASIKERSDRKAVVAVTVTADGVVTAKGEVVAVRMPDSMRREG